MRNLVRLLMATAVLSAAGAAWAGEEAAPSPEGPSLTESGTTHFAQFGAGQGLSSEIILANLSSTVQASGSVLFFDRDGNLLEVDLEGRGPVASTSFTINARGKLVLRTADSDSQVLGTAVVFADTAPVGAVVNFTALGQTTGVPGTMPLTRAVVPVRREMGGVDTGLAIRNAGQDDLDMVLELRDCDGNVVASRPLTLARDASAAQFISQIFPDAAGGDNNFEGTVLLSVLGSADRFAAIALFQGGGVFTTLPVTPLREE